MRIYMLRICGVFIISSVCNMILPDGNIKKYARILMSIIVCITLLSPCDISFDKISYNKSDFEVAEDFENQVTEEYKRRIENMIYEKYHIESDVVLNEKREIIKIILKGEYSEEGVNFIVTQMGVGKESIIYE